MTAPAPPPPAEASCDATSAAAVSAGALSASLVSFPPSAGLSGRPLLVLAAASPLNARGEDIVVATPEACAAWGAASGPACDATDAYAIGGVLYHFAGTAAALNMEASGVCAF